jgi:SAM-dependent methyltransferase
VDNQELLRRFYPESNITGFSHMDGAVSFFSQVAAVLKPTDYVLDFGAGRGEPLIDDAVAYRRSLGNLQRRCAHLEGCDVDDVVLKNPFMDHAEVISLGEPLPYSDDRFDIVVSRNVFEHVEDPKWLAHELLRVLKPGGLIAAVTPNKNGYFALGARLIPNSLHIAVLEKVQPGRKAADIFPTRYRMNTAGALRRVFGHRADVFVSRVSAEPAYHFGSPLVYRLIRFVNKHLPDALQPLLLVYIRKH